MVEMLRNVNLSTLRNEKSLDDLIVECRKQGALEERKRNLLNLECELPKDLIKNNSREELLFCIEKYRKELEGEKTNE